MAKLLEEDVKRKVESFLRSKGQNVDDLSEGELTQLYWNVLNEDIEESEDKNVTQYDFEKEGDIEEFNRDKENVDGEDITLGDGGAQITELDEDSIEDIVRENLNPIMSKSELIQEMSRQLVTEENAYEDELESGDNEYSKHLDPDSVRDMGRRLFNDVRQAAQDKFGVANGDSAAREMGAALMKIITYETGKQPQLQEEAIRLIRDKYPAMTEDVVDIEASITGHPQLGGTAIDRGNMRYEKGDMAPPEGYTEEELKSEVTKRRLVNAMSQGSARKSQNLYHLADNSRVPQNMKDEYGKLMAGNDFVYWSMNRETIKQQGRAGDHAGNSKLVLDPETGKPKIVAQGMTFSILLHELDKGIKELIALHGSHSDKRLKKYVEDQVDHLDSEPDDIRLGVGIWEKVSQVIDIDNPQHEALLFHKLITLPSTEMNSLIKGLVADNENSIQKLQDIADKVSGELRQEEYDDAMGVYDEKSEEQPKGDDEDGFPDPEKEDDGEYSDPLMRDLMGGGSQEKEQPSGEIDYSTMSRPDLQIAMDDALDNNDYALAGKIGPHLNK